MVVIQTIIILCGSQALELLYTSPMQVYSFMLYSSFSMKSMSNWFATGQNPSPNVGVISNKISFELGLH